jgi:hypothetical protein
MIDINLDWSGGVHSRPRVTNSTTQDNPIPASQGSLQWDVKPAQDGVRITGVTFYASQPDKTNKRSAISPTFLNLPGGHVNDDPTTWQIDFVSGNGPTGQTELWYDVLFADNDFSDLDWDPKLTISPR